MSGSGEARVITRAVRYYGNENQYVRSVLVRSKVMENDKVLGH